MVLGVQVILGGPLKTMTVTKKTLQSAFIKLVFETLGSAYHERYVANVLWGERMGSLHILVTSVSIEMLTKDNALHFHCCCFQSFLAPQ